MTDNYMAEKLNGWRVQVVEMAEVCRAWHRFGDLLVAHYPSLNQLGFEMTERFYSDCDQFGMRFPSLNCHKTLRRTIQALCLPGFEVGGDPLLFKRGDIYDKMAYASFPLHWFVETTAKCKVTFSLPMPMVFAVSSFQLKRQRDSRWNKQWWGRLYLHDGRVPVDHRDREVAGRRDFPDEMTREAMFEFLLNEVRKREQECLFAITGDSLIGAMIKAESEGLLELAEKTS